MTFAGRQIVGYYLNPKDESKQAFLARAGQKLDAPPKWEDIPEGKMMVTLVDNGRGLAAAICCSAADYRDHTSSSDSRSRTYYLVDINELIKVGDRDFAEYICGEG